MLAVTLLAALPLVGQGSVAQYGRRAQVSKGPRALGLIQLFPNGAARLIPVAIMADGKFFDAASYKGSPVPMALDFGVVYEGFRTGVSQGLFTITQPGQAGHNWLAEGTWLPAGAKPPQKGMKYEPPRIEDKDAPPRLHRGDARPAEPAPADKAAPPKETPKEPVKPTAGEKPPEPVAIDDPNRPILRRGKPDPATRRELVKNFDNEPAPVQGTDKLAGVQIIPAISDAGGPYARPYNFDLRGNEEANYRTKMLALAADEVARSEAAPPEIPNPKARKAAPRKPAPVAFDDVQIHIYDLSNSNDAVLVLSARTHGPPAGSADPAEVTLVARANLDGDLRRLYFSRTDARHLAISPRLELIDAVDADGDGRGELLFRRITDEGSSYALYRVTADRLWALYEGTP